MPKFTDNVDLLRVVTAAILQQPTTSCAQIAVQVGCSKKYVSKIRKRIAATEPLPDQVVGADGQVYRAERPYSDVVLDARSAGGHLLRSRRVVQARLARMREMADEGYTSQQIAAECGLSVEGCRYTLRRAGIVVRADESAARVRRHDPNRIVERTVVDAENLCADVNLIDFSHLDPTRLAAWVDSLVRSHKALGTFIRHLKEQRTYV